MPSCLNKKEKIIIAILLIFLVAALGWIIYREYTLEVFVDDQCKSRNAALENVYKDPEFSKYYEQLPVEKLNGDMLLVENTDGRFLEFEFIGTSKLVKTIINDGKVTGTEEGARKDLKQGLIVNIKADPFKKIEMVTYEGQ